MPPPPAAAAAAQTSPGLRQILQQLRLYRMLGQPPLETQGVAPPLGGLWESLDAALPEQYYHRDWSPDLENVRVARGLWEPRLGLSLWRTIDTSPSTASGNVRGLFSLYAKDTSVLRLAVRGTKLYDWKEGTDSAFHAVSGGTGLADNVTQAVQVGDSLYLIDRSSGLLRYDAGTRTASVVKQPAAPSTAPQVTKRQYGFLEDWTGNPPYGWTQTPAPPDARALVLTQPTAIDPAPLLRGRNVELLMTNAANGGTVHSRITKDLGTGGVDLKSHAIVFGVELRTAEAPGWHFLDFRIGVNRQGEFRFPITLPAKNQGFYYYAAIGDLTKLRFLEFICRKQPDTNHRYYLSALALPGLLEGDYRWKYTHYNPVTGNESKPSPPTGINSFNSIGDTIVSVSPDGVFACALIDCPGDSAVDASTTQMRIYRNGGVPSLTTDSRGQDVWLLSGVVDDFKTTLSGNVAAGGTVLALTAVGAHTGTTAGVQVGDWLVLNPGNFSQEYAQVASITGLNVTVKTDYVDEDGVIAPNTLAYAHFAGEVIRIVYLDNTANEAIDPTQRIDAERDDPPKAAQCIALSPDDRLWLFRYQAADGSNRPAGVAVSNRATPFRVADQEVFPDGVDPLTRQSPVQGWRFDVNTGGAGEEIVWGGFYRGVPTVLTRTGLFQIHAYSQADWGPTAVTKVLEVGCIAGETVQEVNGHLYWVADGPRVMRWDAQAPPVNISHLRCSERLKNAPQAYWGSWYARGHVKRDGAYYCLRFVPAGATTLTQRLDFNADLDAWEPVVYYDAGFVPAPFGFATVFSGGTDARDLYECHPTSGKVYKVDDAAVLTDVDLTTNAARPVRFRALSKRHESSFLQQLDWLFGRGHAGAGGTDTVTVTVSTGGGEYPDASHAYSFSLAAVTDTELRSRLHFSDFLGRWYQVLVSGDCSYGPALRECVIQGQSVREGIVRGP